MPLKLKDVVNSLLERDPYDMYRWVMFLAEKKIDCKSCVEVAAFKNRLPNCIKCIPTKDLINKSKRTLEERSKQHGIKS